MILPRISHRVGIAAVAITLTAAACGGSAETGEPTTTAAAATTVTTLAPPTSASGEAPAPNDGAVVASGDSISVHYVGTLDSGEQFDSSRDRGQPLSFVVGSGQTISGFDAAVRGMMVGDVKTVRLSPDDAYGEATEELVIEVTQSQVPEDVQVGDVLRSPEGLPATVVSIDGEAVTLDMNHQLAGEFLTFEIELVAIDG